MKKTIILTLGLVLVFSLSACTQNKSKDVLEYESEKRKQEQLMEENIDSSREYLYVHNRESNFTNEEMTRINTELNNKIIELVEDFDESAPYDREYYPNLSDTLSIKPIIGKENKVLLEKGRCAWYAINHDFLNNGYIEFYCENDLGQSFSIETKKVIIEISSYYKEDNSKCYSAYGGEIILGISGTSYFNVSLFDLEDLKVSTPQDYYELRKGFVKLQLVNKDAMKLLDLSYDEIYNLAEPNNFLIGDINHEGKY